MIITLSGANDFARRFELKKLTEAFIKEHSEFGLEKIEAGEIELGRLLESVASLPFLATRRMIVLYEPGANKSINENVEQLLDAVADSTDLIIVEPKFDKRSVLYKTLKKRTEFKEFGVLDERALASWLVNEAKIRGGEIKPADATHLVQRTGDNQLALSNELDKLLAYEPQVSRANIDLLTDPLPRSTVFELLDAAFSGNTKRALFIYKEQRKLRVEPQAIMAMIAWQLHVLAIVKTSDKLSPDEIASKAKLNPYVVRKTVGLANRLSLAQVKDLISRALKLDVRLKTETVDADDALQHLLITLV